MSFINLNPKNPAQSSTLQTARSVKNEVKNMVGRFQKLNDVPGVDLASQDKDVVVVNNQTDLPQSTGNKLARLAVGMLAPEQTQPKASGYSQAENGEVKFADVTTEENGQKSNFEYSKLSDGTEVFSAPTETGYAVVRENKANGTLFIAQSDNAMPDVFQQAISPNFQAPPSSDAPLPKTLEQSLEDMSGNQEQAPLAAEGSNSLDKLKQATSSWLPTSEELGQKAEALKSSGQQAVDKVSKEVKEFGPKMDTAVQDTTKAVKDWTKSDTAKNVGNILFGKLNPFG